MSVINSDGGWGVSLNRNAPAPFIGSMLVSADVTEDVSGGTATVIQTDSFPAPIMARRFYKVRAGRVWMTAASGTERRALVELRATDGSLYTVGGNLTAGYVGGMRVFGPDGGSLAQWIASLPLLAPSGGASSSLALFEVIKANDNDGVLSMRWWVDYFDWPNT